MLRKTIGEWDERRLAQFVSSLPIVRKTVEQFRAVGAILNPLIKTTSDILYFDGFNWIAGKITNAMVSATAAIAYSKLALTNSIVNADIAGAAAIAYSKLSLALSIVNGDISASADIARSKLATTTIKRDLPLRGRTSGPPAAPWPDAASNYVSFVFLVAEDYVSGDITVKIVRRADVSTNTAVMNRSVYRIRDATATTTIESGTAMNFTPGDTNAHIVSFTIGSANFQADDCLIIDVFREGGDAGDTLVGNVEYHGMWIEYTGRP